MNDLKAEVKARIESAMPALWYIWPGDKLEITKGEAKTNIEITSIMLQMQGDTGPAMAYVNYKVDGGGEMSASLEKFRATVLNGEVSKLSGLIHQ